MNLLPLIERELRVALRKRQPVRARFRMAAGCTAGALLYILITGLDVRSGSGLHQILCAIGLIIVVRTPQLVAGSFADERRNQTLGFLFLSGLSAGEIFVSKVFSAAMIAFNSLLAMFPLLALPFLMGGVSFELFLATVFGLPNLLLFMVSVSLLASVLTKDDGAAIILSRALTIIICAATLVLYAILERAGSKPSQSWLCLSPAYAPYLLFTGLKAGAAAFWWNWLLTFAWSMLCLATAAFALNRLWRQYQEGSEPDRQSRFWQRIFHGSALYRQGLRKIWMEVNPYVWLVARDQLPTMLGWVAIFGVIAIWLIGWAIWPKFWLTPFSLFLTAIFWNVALSWVVDYTAAKTIGNPRHDGAYELLLTTPLNPSDIVWGEMEALRRLLRPLLWTVMTLELVLLLAGLAMRHWNLVTLGLYLATWFYLIYWTFHIALRSRHLFVVLWVGLNSARPAFAAWRAEGSHSNVWIWIWFFVTFSNFSRKYPSGSWQEFLLVFLAAALLINFRRLNTKKITDGADTWESRLVTQFRGIVREPIPDPHDPRYKNWDVCERFPWGWEATEDRIRERLSQEMSGRGLYTP